MVLAIISDTHLPRGRRALPAACVERLRAADLVVHAGDLAAAAVLEELEALGPPVAAVHGNADDAELRRRLPAQRVVEAGGARIAVLHDAGPAAGRLARLQRRRDPATGFQIFNPGSPTDRRRQPQHTMGLASARDGAVAFELVVLE